MAVILKERHGWGLARAELLHLALQKFLLGLKLVLAAQCYLQPLYCLLQHQRNIIYQTKAPDHTKN